MRSQSEVVVTHVAFIQSFGHFLEDLEFPWAMNEISSSAITFVFPALKRELS